jgi:hypothetical protein
VVSELGEPLDVQVDIETFSVLFSKKGYESESVIKEKK